MTEQALFTALMPVWIGVAAITFLSLFFKQMD